MSDAWVQDVLTFWFDELQPIDWFKKNQEVDSAIHNRFSSVFEQVAALAPEQPGQPIRAVLAAVIVLDQFPRNMFRGSPRSFATDKRALALAEREIALGHDLELSTDERQFLYMPYQHSEDKAVQARSMEVFATLGNDNLLDYAKRHKQIIDRFGRFPHRNEVMGRASSEEEVAFLTQPGSSF